MGNPGDVILPSYGTDYQKKKGKTCLISSPKLAAELQVSLSVCKVLWDPWERHPRCARHSMSAGSAFPLTWRCSAAVTLNREQTHHSFCLSCNITTYKQITTRHTQKYPKTSSRGHFTTVTSFPRQSSLDFCNMWLRQLLLILSNQVSKTRPFLIIDFRIPSYSTQTQKDVNRPEEK